MEKVSRKIGTYGRMIKFEHTIFAFPFALSALMLANRQNTVTLRIIFWILLAVVFARSAGMGFNRLVDAQWDARNPRTSDREIPSGNITAFETAVFVIVSSILFILSAAAISLLCFIYSIPLLLILFGYSYTKRFTWMSHIVLGFVQALGPIGVWLAVTGGFSVKIFPLALALGTYIAGFDLLYACQDVEFDRSAGLYSMPANFGIKRAFLYSAILHIVTFLSLLSLYRLFNFSFAYLVFAAVIGILLAVEHTLVKPHDLSKIHIAFFHVNGIISILIFTAILTEEIIIRYFPP